MRKKGGTLDIETLIKEADLYNSPMSEKQRDILDAAEKLFSEHGFSDTPTAEIAKKAKVTERTLFKYFPSKTDLLKRVMFPILLKFFLPLQFKRIKAVLSESEDPETLFKLLFEDRMSLAQEHGDKLKFVMIEMLKNDSLREQCVQLWRQELWSEALKLIEKLKKAGKIRTDVKSETIGRAMITLVIGYIFSSQVFANRWDHDENMAELTKIFLDGVRPV